MVDRSLKSRIQARQSKRLPGFPAIDLTLRSPETCSFTSSMIRIGDFARISGVSVATLRHYDETGVLRPARVDEATGYRYYEIQQLARLQRVLVLRDLGLALHEIDPDLSAADLQRLLERKRSEVERRVAEETERLERIARRIQLIEKENDMPELDVIKKTTSPVTLAYRRVHVPTNDEVGGLLDEAYGRVFAALHRRGVTPKGACMGVWHSAPDEFTNEVVDASVPVPEGTEGDDEFEVVTLPETEVASVVYRGPFDAFPTAHRTLTAWLEGSGYRLEGAYREIYFEAGGDDAVVEIQYPLGRR